MRTVPTLHTNRTAALLHPEDRLRAKLGTQRGERPAARIQHTKRAIAMQ
jgi:hypothetical protein